MQRIDTGTDELLCTIEDGVATLTLNRPEARNALSDTLSPAIREMVPALGENKDVGVLIITGAGNAFCAGGDVKGMGGRSTKREMTVEERENELITRHRGMSGAIYNLKKPTIAVLPGAAVGAGLSIALSCDIRIAAESAFVSTGYARIGLSGDYGIAWYLTQLVGPSKARELLFTSERVDAAACEKLGLVNHVFPDETVREEALKFAKTIASGPVLAMGYMKENLIQAMTTDLDGAIVQEAKMMVKAAATNDHREAVEAFVEKRQPNFTGT